MKSNPHTYTDRADAIAAKDSLNSGDYYLAPGEYARPDYAARKIRGGSRYYLYARRYYYAGTLHAKKSGPVTIQDLHNL